MCSTKEPWDAAPGEVKDLVQCMRQIHQAGCWDGPNLSDFDGETSDAGWPPQQKWRSMWPADSLWYLWIYYLYTFYSNCMYFPVPCQLYTAHEFSWRYLKCIFPEFPVPLFTERLCLVYFWYWFSVILVLTSTNLDTNLDRTESGRNIWQNKGSKATGLDIMVCTTKTKQSKLTK